MDGHTKTDKRALHCERYEEGTSTLIDEIILNLRAVYDPEISINVYDLGLIYEINIKDDTYEADVVMTLTSALCPVADYLVNQVKEAVEMVLGEGNANVTITFDPLWEMHMIPEHARLEIGLL